MRKLHQLLSPLSTQSARLAAGIAVAVLLAYVSLAGTASAKPFEDYIKPMGISVLALSLAPRMSYSRLREIVDEKRGVSADTALRLERYFGSEAQGWRQEIAPLAMAA